MKAKERSSKLKRLRKDHHLKPSKLRNLVKKSMNKKVLMKMSSPLSQERSIQCENTKEDPNGRATQTSTQKK
ncbi:hypothetical protein CR513_62698, partial [Mucuna pruriens]